MLHKDYDRKFSVAKTIIGHDFQGAWRQDELMGDKPPGKVKVVPVLN
jgi:hypothetical protein